MSGAATAPVAPRAGSGTPADAAGVPRRPAVVAGSALLLMAVAAGWAAVGVIEPVVGAADPVATLAGGTGALRAAVAAMLLVAVLDVVVAWALFDVLRATHEGLARLGAWLRTAYAAGFVVAVAHLLVAVRLVEDGGGPASGAAVARELATFHVMWDVGLLLVGLHLVVVGAVVLRAPAFPRWLGVLVVVAGVGYAADASVVVLVPGPQPALTTVTFVGEVALAVWLLVRAARDRPRA